jgi:SAM-dependent methyltransferase
MQVIRTIDELDRKIAECDAAEAVSDDAMRHVFSTFIMEAPSDLPVDPFSPEYRLAQLELYHQIAGDHYNTAKEVTKFDVAAAFRRPFPFATNSSATAGEYFMAIGFALKTMALPPRSRVLEFGAGWGFTSLWLAQLGHSVTVVDIEPCFCDLIARRAVHDGVEIEVVNADFFWIEQITRTFDAVLFYDCFHHCSDHIRLLTALRDTVTPEGRIFFGAEPIVPDFPVPWGLRLDGWSLWGIRKHGWMELGFRDDYFAGALWQTGWFGRKIAVPGVDRLRVWEARHRSNAVFRFAATDPRLHTQVGTRRDGAIVLDGAAKGTGLFGPYIDLPAGHYLARLRFRPNTVLEGRAVMDVACNTGTRLVHTSINTKQGCEAHHITETTFASNTDLNGVEVRLFCEAAFSATLESVEIVPLALGDSRPGPNVRSPSPATRHTLQIAILLSAARRSISFILRCLRLAS